MLSLYMNLYMRSQDIYLYSTRSLRIFLITGMLHGEGAAISKVIELLVDYLVNFFNPGYFTLL
jgi:hypothetical protein